MTRRVSFRGVSEKKAPHRGEGEAKGIVIEDRVKPVVILTSKRARRSAEMGKISAVARSRLTRKPSAPFCVLQTASVSQLRPRRSPSGRGFFFFQRRAVSDSGSRRSTGP